MFYLSKIFGVIILLACVRSYGQTEFDVMILGNYQFIQDDGGYNIEGSISYHLNQQLGIGVYGSYSLIQSDQFEFDYDINKGGLQTSYKFNKDHQWSLESVLGFCLVAFDDRIGLENNTGFGVDLGLRFSYKVFKKLSYGLQLNTTYIEIAPGSLGAVGLFFCYELK